jgi:hypothetical protein
MPRTRPVAERNTDQGRLCTKWHPPAPMQFGALTSGGLAVPALHPGAAPPHRGTTFPEPLRATAESVRGPEEVGDNSSSIAVDLAGCCSSRCTRAKQGSRHAVRDRASADLKPVRAVGPVEAAASGRPAAKPTGADGLTTPNPTWTVVQLRAEARARGLAGMSNKPKAKLLAALTRDA